MKPKDVLFDEDLEFYTVFPHTKKEICISIVDYLEASEEKLTIDYRTKISDFINNSKFWYDKSIAKIKDRAIEEYNQIAKYEEIELMEIFILFEQNEKELYGLGFRVGFDIEHGCGLQITGSDFEIVKVGDDDVAFCL